MDYIKPVTLALYAYSDKKGSYKTPLGLIICSKSVVLGQSGPHVQTLGLISDSWPIPNSMKWWYFWVASIARTTYDFVLLFCLNPVIDWCNESLSRDSIWVIRRSHVTVFSSCSDSNGSKSNILSVTAIMRANLLYTWPDNNARCSDMQTISEESLHFPTRAIIKFYLIEINPSS